MPPKVKVAKEDITDKLESFAFSRVSVSEPEEEIEPLKEDEMETCKMLKVLMKRVGKKPEVIEIPDTLKAKQELVGGLIEIVQYDDVLLVCNEEGKILNMPPNLIFEFDYIAGDCFIMGENINTGEWRDLTQSEIETYSRELDRRSYKWIEEDRSPRREKERGERMRGKS